MRPYLAELLNRLFGTGIFTYLLPNFLIVLALTVVAVTVVGVRWAERRRLDPQRVYGLVLWAFPAAVLGGRLAHVAYASEDYRGGVLAFLDPLQGSSVSYGGLLAGGICGLLYLRWHREPIAPYLDLAAPLLGFGIAAGRLGCFLDGCDFGARACWEGIPLPAIHFPPGSPASIEHAGAGWLPHGSLPSLPVHPVQLYLSASALAIGLGVWLWQRRHPEAVPGRSFALFWLLYAVSRWSWEWLRGDTGRGLWGPLSTAQWISIPVAMAAFAFLWWTRRRPAEVRV